MAETKAPSAWTQQDAIALRSFIADNPNFLSALAKRRPKITGGTMEERAVTGSDVNGFLIAIETIEAMQLDPQGAGENPGFIDNSQQVD